MNFVRASMDAVDPQCPTMKENRLKLLMPQITDCKQAIKPFLYYSKIHHARCRKKKNTKSN